MNVQVTVFLSFLFDLTSTRSFLFPFKVNITLLLMNVYLLGQLVYLQIKHIISLSFAALSSLLSQPVLLPGSPTPIILLTPLSNSSISSHPVLFSHPALPPTLPSHSPVSFYYSLFPGGKYFGNGDNLYNQRTRLKDL